MDSNATIKDVTRILTSSTDDERNTYIKQLNSFTKAVDSGRTPFVEVNEPSDTIHCSSAGTLHLTPRKKSNLKNGGATVPAGPTKGRKVNKNVPPLCAFVSQ